MDFQKEIRIPGVSKYDDTLDSIELRYSADGIRRQQAVWEDRVSSWPLINPLALAR